MTRVARPIALNFDVHLALLIGRVEGDGLSDEDLRLAWHYHRGKLVDEYSGPLGSRPWGWWAFEAGEEMPCREVEPLRLAELGELRPEEVAALRERANEARLRVDKRGCPTFCV